MEQATDSSSTVIAPFDWTYWNALWELRRLQLAEEGIFVEPVDSVAVDLDSPYEQDYHRIEQVYLSGAGGFWIAFHNGDPAGHVGAQDIGGAVELRRLYVRAECRRLGIGAALVRTLLERCRQRRIPVVELWTQPDGPGRRLYAQHGFRAVAERGAEYDREALCLDLPNHPAARMRLELDRR